MSEILPGGQPPEGPKNRRAIDQAVDVARTTFSLIKSVVFIMPLFILLIVVVLALSGPAIGNIFSNIVNSL